MKVRIYSPFFPYPVTEGAFQVIYDQALGFARYHDVELVVWKDSPEQIAQKAQAGIETIFGPRLKLVCWGNSLAKKESQAHRTLRLLKSFLQKDASPCLFYYPPEFDRRSELGEADLAIYHYTFAWSWLSRSPHPPEKKKVVYLHNIESDLFEYRAKCEPNPILKLVHGLNARKLRHHEVDLANCVDEYWHISQKDLIDTQKRTPHLPVRHSVKYPTYHDAVFEVRSRRFLNKYSPVAKPVIGFIGGLDFDANRASLDWILTHVCPRLDNLGFQGRFLVVGKHAPDHLLEKGRQFSFFEYLGFVPDLNEFWDSLSLMLVPHVSGSGVRIKLLDSLAAGIPVLANDQAVERIHPDLLNSPYLTVSSNPEKWAQFIMQLKGQELRRSLQSFGLDTAHRFESVYSEFITK